MVSGHAPTLNIWSPTGPEPGPRLPRPLSPGAAPGSLTQTRCPGNLSPSPGQRGPGTGASAQARGRSRGGGSQGARPGPPESVLSDPPVTPGHRVGGAQSPGRREEEEEAAPGDWPSAGAVGGWGGRARPVALRISKARGHTPSSRSAPAFGDAANPALRGGGPVPGPVPCPGCRASPAPSRISLPLAPPRTCDSPGGLTGAALASAFSSAQWKLRKTPPV